MDALSRISTFMLSQGWSGHITDDLLLLSYSQDNVTYDIAIDCHGLDFGYLCSLILPLNIYLSEEALHTVLNDINQRNGNLSFGTLYIENLQDEDRENLPEFSLMYGLCARSQQLLLDLTDSQLAILPPLIIAFSNEIRSNMDEALGIETGHLKA